METEPACFFENNKTNINKLKIPESLLISEKWVVTILINFKANVNGGIAFE